MKINISSPSGGEDADEGERKSFPLFLYFLTFLIFKVFFLPAICRHAIITMLRINRSMGAPIN
jgi:hypothetical protein